VACVGASSVPAQTAIPDVSASSAYEHLKVLAGQIGERTAGSEAEARGAEYIASQFRSYGLKTTIEKFPIPTWREQRARLWTDGGQVVDFPAKTVVFGGVTKPEGIVKDFVDIGAASLRDVKSRELRDKIVLVRRDAEVDYPDYWLTDRLIPLGVAGMIFYSSPGRSAIPAIYFNYKRSLKEATPPSVEISYEDALRLVQMQPKKVGLVAVAETEWKESQNIIGELTGSARPGELVLFSAHNDTAYSSPGAADDGGGVACVTELARAFSRGPRPARTLRFIAWGAEELGLIGSEAYLRAHESEIPKTVAMINYDGMGAALGVVGWVAAGADDWINFLHQTLAPAELEEPSSVGVSGTDSTNFGAVEVPNIDFSQRGDNGDSHTPRDNLQETSADGLANGLLLAAMVGERLAMDTNLTFSHEFPPEILKEVRDYAARWGWGVRPEANLDPKPEPKK
jgi:hypothetical protein